MTETETKPASLAVRILCQQFIQNIQAQEAELKRIAFESDGFAPEGWAFDVATASYTKRDV